MIKQRLLQHPRFIERKTFKHYVIVEIVVDTIEMQSYLDERGIRWKGCKRKHPWLRK